MIVAGCFKTCVNKKTEEFKAPTRIHLLEEAGCTTGKTDFDGRKNCDEDICRFAPFPGSAILDNFNVWSHSAFGDEHTFNGPTCNPDPQNCQQACFHVHARSGDAFGTRGTQKINVDADVRKVPTQLDINLMMDACETECDRS